MLIDRDHLLAELYAMSNVPTVVWIDADDRIARPNAAEVGTDIFAEFTAASADAHRRAVIEWVRRGVVPADAAHDVADLDDDEVDARLAFRIAVHLRRRGDDAGAGRWFARASSLAPLDFSVSRAAMPLTGRDPFGEEFLEIFEAWRGAGAPIHGLGPHRSDR